ncbi:flagellar basal body-associated protein FliL [Alkaliphilus metalliredigens QYMF]|uniref:Flagellar protein FliL n=1 Tax=Alkaliphilus metalliredigens (strain QYMF) TaxID=293826 RepID=A6TKW9_ALKMQ|nr:flagellar basal body-associated FliL family protein [Alkaliphilus metalliredigens]ABR46837.1 flagellar basal body-associated protein FliL [Alkaliphilus metalliredigens QYMF]
METKKVIIYALIALVLSTVVFGGILYFTIFRTPDEMPAEVKVYEYNLGGFSTNLSTVRSYFKGEMVIETTEKALLSVFVEKNAELRDQIIKVFIGKESVDILDPDGQQQLREELIRVISNVTKSDKITNLYFVDYIIQ